MEEVLKNSINKLKSNNYSELNLVIGNESCDLDSAVSSIAYALFLDWQHNQIKCKVCTRNKRGPGEYRDDIFIPILNVNREDFPLKTEVAFVLKKKQLKEDSLVFRDDFDFAQLVTKTKTNVTLVDHHVLSGKDQFFAPYVTEIIDHRPIDKTSWNYKEDTRSTIEIVGSCATLVSQRIKDLATLLAKDVDFFNSYQKCADLLHSTIVVDTANFSKELNKATSHDENIVLFLESLIDPSDFEFERKRKFDMIIAARKDVSSFTAAQLLKKDVKIAADVLVPSFPILVKEFLRRPNAVKAMTEALTREGCSTVLLLGMTLAEGLKRDAAVYGTDRDKTARFGAFLESWKNPSLNLRAEVSAIDECLYYSQQELSASRKQYMSAVNQFLATEKK